MAEIGDTFAAALAHESVRPVERRVRVLVGEEVLADTDEAMLFAKRGSKPVVFVPTADVRPGLLTSAARPGPNQFAKPAAFWDIHARDIVHEGLAWRFTEPRGELLPLAGYVAFDPERVTFDMEGKDGDIHRDSSASDAAHITSMLHE